MASEWPDYKRYLRDYERYSRRLNGVLYKMCEDMPGHTVDGEVWAKVWIIGRAYASGIERHAADGLDPIVAALRSSARWLDRGLASLRALDPIPSRDRLPDIAQLHGRLVGIVAKHTRDGNQVRSFVSKYLHFHAPVVPIYDSVVSQTIRSRSWYPWSRRLTAEHPTPTNADEVYWRHCVRIARIVEDWQAAGLEPTARNIDTYVYRWKAERQ